MKRKTPAPPPEITPDDAALFREAIGEVRELAPPPAAPERPRPPPEPRMQARDEALALVQSRTASYLAATIETALAEVRHHQNQYWSGVHGLNYERFVFRGLSCSFAGDSMKDAASVPMSDPIYDPDDYSHAQRLGGALKKAGCPGLRYLSVRSEGDHCWALLTPRPVSSIVQAAHYEMVWNGQITSVSKISEA